MIAFILPLVFLSAFTNAADLADGSSDSIHSHPIYERTISDISDILAEGVFIDYRYNDTDDGDSIGGLPSAPGCPKNDAGLPWVYYPPGLVTPNTRCYLVGTKGPCKRGEKLFAEKGSPFGYCNCECFEYMDRIDTGREIFCNSYSYDDPKFVFHPATKKCYQLYTQGHCGENEWLVEVIGRSDPQNPKSSSSSLEPLTKCEKRKCSEGLYPVWKNGTNGELLLECTSPIMFGGGGSYSNLIPSECSNKDEKYSKLLRKCIAKFSYTSIG